MSQKEEYAITIVSIVLARYDRIVGLMDDAMRLREVVQARGSFLKGEAPALGATLGEARAAIASFRNGYLSKEDLSDFLEIEKARKELRAPRVPRSEYGNQIAHNEYLSWAIGEEMALWAQLDSLKTIMFKRKWFELKGKTKTDLPTPWSR